MSTEKRVPTARMPASDKVELIPKKKTVSRRMAGRLAYLLSEAKAMWYYRWDSGTLSCTISIHHHQFWAYCRDESKTKLTTWHTECVLTKSQYNTPLPSRGRWVGAGVDGRATISIVSIRLSTYSRFCVRERNTFPHMCPCTILCSYPIYAQHSLFKQTDTQKEGERKRQKRNDHPTTTTIIIILILILTKTMGE